MRGHLYLACINVIENRKKNNSWTKCIFMLLSPCQIKYYGWKFRVEAHFGKKDSNCPGSLLSSSKGFYAFGGIINSRFGSREYTYFAKLLSNSKQLGYNSCFWLDVSSTFFFSIVNLETVKVRWKNTSSTSEIKLSRTYLDDAVLTGFSCPNLFMKDSLISRF